MNPRRRKFLIVATIFLATHSATACYYAHRFATGAIHDGPAAPLSLEMTPQQWARAIPVRDGAGYLRGAAGVAEGKGPAIRVADANGAHYESFYYWGPGAPFVMGWWLRLMGSRTMFGLFMFAVASQAFFGLAALATVALWTRNTAALAVTAFCGGFCPPLQNYFQGINLTMSEMVGLVPLSVLTFALAKAFLALREAPAEFSAALRSWRTLSWFAVAGLAIGLHSIVRDSGQIFALFVSVVLVGRSLLLDRRRLGLALVSAALVLTMTSAVRWPVKMWNQAQIGQPVVSTSGNIAIWRYGLWMPLDWAGVHSFVLSCAPDASPELASWLEHDLYDWRISAGFSFGRDLDPAAADRVEKYYSDGRPRPALYAMGQFAQAVAAHPAEAIEFKARRLPVLWLDAPPWPDTRWTLTSYWCLGFYGLLAVLIVARVRGGGYLPEPVYLYLALIVCASPLIQFEFRYSLPIWHGLVLVPGLIVERFASPAPNRRRQVADRGRSAG